MWRYKTFWNKLVPGKSPPDRQATSVPPTKVLSATRCEGPWGSWLSCDPSSALCDGASNWSFLEGFRATLRAYTQKNEHTHIRATKTLPKLGKPTILASWLFRACFRCEQGKMMVLSIPIWLAVNRYSIYLEQCAVEICKPSAQFALRWWYPGHGRWRFLYGVSDLMVVHGYPLWVWSSLGWFMHHGINL